jgi:hypothetical protein
MGKYKRKLTIFRFLYLNISFLLFLFRGGQGSCTNTRQYFHALEQSLKMGVIVNLFQ